MATALDTLIELASRQSDEAAQRLGQAMRTCQDTEQKLAMLLQYREEYDSRLQAGLAAGISISGYRNFQLFLEKLDAAIAGQQRLVQDAQRRMAAQRGEWHACERKRVSFDTLATRHQQAALKKEGRRDQKMMDEFATRQANFKR